MESCSSDYLEKRRQRINLSDEAFSVIENDRFSFNDKSEVITYSHMISKIFCLCVKTSCVIEQDSKKVEALLIKKPRVAQTTLPSIRNDVFKIIEESGYKTIVNSTSFRGSYGKFIKVVIEEYAEKPLVERERIFYSSTVSQIQMGIKLANKMLIHSGEVRLIVRAYKIMSDKQSHHNYLVCYAKSEDSDRPERITSLRISRIRSVEIIPDSSGFLNDYEKDVVVDAISKREVEFLRGEPETIVVRFSEYGKVLFSSLIFQRPNIVSTEGDEYTFKCTRVQARNFFFKFGADAEIVSPVALRDEFSKKYREATLKYSMSDNTIS